MSSFLEQYGKAIFILVLVAILIAFAGPLGMKIKSTTTEKVSQTEQIGKDEIRNSMMPKEAVDQVWCYLDKNGELVISQNKITAPADALIKEKQLSQPFSITSNRSQIKTVRFDGAVMSKSCDSWFWSCVKLTEIKNIENLYTNECTSMSYMFYNCSNLTNLDVSNFDTSKVRGMSYMFYLCKSLTSLDVSNFDTSKVRGMSYMFYLCKSLTNLDLSNFDISKVTDMDSMFYNCSSLQSITATQIVKDKILSKTHTVPSTVIWIIK